MSLSHLVFDQRRQRLTVLGLVLVFVAAFFLSWSTLAETTELDGLLAGHAFNPFPGLIGVVTLVSMLVTGIVVGLVWSNPKRSWPIPSRGHVAVALGFVAAYLVTITPGNSTKNIVHALAVGLFYLVGSILSFAFKKPKAPTRTQQ